MQERRLVNDTGMTRFFTRVYSTMGAGMGVTALVTYLLGTVFQTQFFNFIGTNRFVYYIFLFLPLILSFMISGRRGRENAGYATGMFMALAASYGVTFAVIMSMFSGTTVAMAFITTGIVFLVMSLVGRFGNRDLSRAGSIAFTFFIGVFLMSIVNIFLHSGTMTMILSYAILIIFIVMTAWDTQNLKKMYVSMGGESAATNSLAVQGALMLYLDFLNLFIAILQIFGVSDRN
ncbi:Bax inhibitor-1/YccA family protein [Lacticaseibacillus saniviri]|uniref:Integral membrane protein n=2 Tax=Lacticaseibacillus saniviri TaxID=931533 RepID=A0A0R2MTB1_9LACO|nr:Bax inhibitor-1/YccA family protein [Lacticaseibacillus saniviri]KRO16665.1 integral membrane protein [Lacticaseibacillus saniviri JCM 17471 = DSM 24301]MCG4282107.1 Bax inhibitor-1/YccA family protein [Lacticaseibacillus saniviri]